MVITRKKSRDTSTLVFEGDLTIYFADQLKAELFADADELGKFIALDLQAVSEMDTAGIQLLLFSRKYFTEQGKKVFIAKNNESVESVLTCLALNDQFSREDKDES